MSFVRFARYPFIAAGCIAFVLLTAVTLVHGEDAQRPPWTTSRIHGTPEAPEPYRIVSAFPKVRFEKPTSIEKFAGADRLLVTEMGGKIYSLSERADVGQADLVVDLKQWLPPELATRNVSLLDAELHPRFPENCYLYVCYVHPGEGGHTRVSRLTLDEATPPRAVQNSEVVILTWPPGGHNAGCLEFGPDGLLYIATGDGSGPNPPDGLTTGQTVTDLLGAILRIDVDAPTRERAYAIPADNPFIALPGARPEIWAYGLRNPWKFGIDGRTGQVFAADNGWESWEMIHRLTRGSNGGWPVMEGRAALRSEVAVGPTPIVPPVKDHPHSEANSVIGGPVYRGQKLSDLNGAFVYGDYITGTLWAIQPDKDESYSCTTLVDTDLRVVAFGEGSRGELYVLDYDFTGQIYELLPSDLKDTSATFPRRLSETGLFKSLDKLKPAPGVVPYTVRVDRWLDGAQPQRWIAVPDRGQVQLSTDAANEASYPEGTVLVKQVTLNVASEQQVRLETQLLHFEGGSWRPYSYLWDDAGRDATLVESLGTTRSLRSSAAASDGGADRTWHVNAINECKLCHNAAAGFVLGFTGHQLQRPVADGDTAAIGQLHRLVAQGVLTEAPPIAADSSARLVDPWDATQSLDDRARSYLHANCSMCHQPGGNAIVSFYLRRDLPFEKLNTNKGTGIGTFGLRDAKIIVPGDPYRSVLLYRMSKLGYARMPYIGSRVVDGRAVALVSDWIRSLPADSAVSSDAAWMEIAQSQLRPNVVSELLQTTGGALALVDRLHHGGVEANEFRQAVARGAAAPTSDIRGLVETFIPESQRRATLGTRIDPQTILQLTGNAQRGKLIFFSDGARCRACHETDDRHKSFGPTMHEITKKYARLDELLQHVLQPSLKIDEPFAAFTAVVDDGRIVTGLLVEQTDREVVVKTPERHLVRIPRQQLETLERSDKSLMPDRVLSDLTAQEAADLFAYIRSQQASP